MNNILHPVISIPRHPAQSTANVDIFAALSANIKKVLLYDGTFDVVRAKEWVDRNPDYLQPILTKILNHIIYIDKETFFGYLEKSAESLKAAIGTRPLQCFDYCGIYGKTKSNYWMSRLCIDKWFPRCEYVDFCPADLNLSFYELGAVRTQYGEIVKNLQAQKIKDIVLFDDASYSGQQLSYELFAITQILKSYDLRGFVIHVVCPFMTSDSKVRIHEFLQRKGSIDDFVQIVYHDSYRIPLLKELLTPQEVNMLAAYGRDVGRPKPGEKSYLYFWHKLADQLSFPEAIAQGKTPYTRDVLPFIEAPTPPYKH